jgi:putative PIN family toxin of toxin-antitoxin system
MRLVLDTNVWLDWLVFADAGVTPIKNAVAQGVACVFISSRCETELARVLGYPLSGRSLDAPAQAAALSHCRSLTHHDYDAAMAHNIAALPRCADPDDQMFLELARDCGADFLVTKDRDLLALAVRKVTPLPFRIVTPHAWARDALPSSSIG